MFGIAEAEFGGLASAGYAMKLIDPVYTEVPSAWKRFEWLSICLAIGGPLQPVWLHRLFAALVQGVLNAEPADVIDALPNSNVAFGLMLFFGVVVVLLLLNLLIARFAKTFDMVYENVDANFKVKRARAHLRSLRD